MALVPCQVLRVAILLSYCSILCNYKAIEMPSHQTYGGSWKFLTFIDLVVQAVFFGICVLTDLSSLLTRGSGNQEQERQLKKLIALRDWMLAVLAFPVGIFVVAVFWIIYAYDREMIYPKLLDNFIPGWLNHGMAKGMDASDCHFEFQKELYPAGQSIPCLWMRTVIRENEAAPWTEVITIACLSNWKDILGPPCRLAVKTRIKESILRPRLLDCVDILPSDYADMILPSDNAGILLSDHAGILPSNHADLILPFHYADILLSDHAGILLSDHAGILPSNHADLILPFHYAGILPSDHPVVLPSDHADLILPSNHADIFPSVLLLPLLKPKTHSIPRRQNPCLWTP